MKAISLWEPWATLIAMGLKRYETRSWETFYRGPLLICASKKKLPFIEISTILFAAKIGLDDLSYGKAVAICEMRDIFPTGNLEVDDMEKRFGDFSPGRYAWKLENVQRLKSPLNIHVRGQQRLFDVPLYINPLVHVDRSENELDIPKST